MPQDFSHRVVMIVAEGSNPFEMGVATELFGLARPELDTPWYDFELCAENPSVTMHAGFFRLSGVSGLDAVDRADTVIVPNRPDPGNDPSPAVLDAVRGAAARGARLASFCTGSFVLAAAGVLDGRRATTHWRWADLFAERFPAVRLDPDVLFVDDGDIVTAAGSAAALDACLQLIRHDHGARTAAAVSRRLVFAPHRDGGQRQFVEQPLPEVPDTSLSPLLTWAATRLATALTTADPGPVRRIFVGPRRLAPHLAALSDRPSTSSTWSVLRLARHGTRRRGLIHEDPPDRPWPPTPRSARPPCTAASAPNWARPRWPGSRRSAWPWRAA
ncbi:DJ-1/PfpI family protein [Streptomyces liangshanensis]|uniref:DJ-1/PfpI family protein n=1 Tax=Streptomyces liangshanensis TaxID=2717324 RepID=UPI001FB9A655|nr:DJ-1/PfpI family protein [Streptomyces liangshanensis]